MPKATIMDHEYDVLGGYIPSFVQHLQDTRARLGLRTGSQANEADAGEEGTEASWTPTEQDAFFRAVSVHTRWRPDLIAACVPTKTEWDVWMYLEALEEGAATTAQQSDEDLDMEDGPVDKRRDVQMQVDPGSCSHSDSDTDGVADLCESALEVSQAWIDAEEHMASWVIDEEHRAAVEGDAATNTVELDDKPRKPKRGRPRGTGRERAQRRARGQAISDKISPPPVDLPASPENTSMSPRAPSQDTPAVHARKREALMGCLGAPHLQILDNILREGEKAMKERSKSRESPVAAASLTDHGDDRAPRACDVDMSSLSDRITGPQETNNVPDAVVDPVLLALSGATDPAGRQSGQVPSESAATNCAPAHVPAQGSSSSPNASSQPTSFDVSTLPRAFTFPQDDTSFNPGPNANVESDLSLFSPGSRRRIKKRLYMRRKRASLRADAASEGVIDTGIEKLKPGRRARSERIETSVVSTSVPCSEVPSDPESELPENVPKKNKPGLTLPYKLKAKFSELGVDAAYLRSQGMDLLNLGALGRLMGLYSSLEDVEDADGSASVESIDAPLIQSLQVTVISFLTDIIHRAIVWREREIRLKQRSRVWRHGDQITTSAIEHAVEAVGARYHSHKAYLKALEARHGLSIEASSTPANATDEPNPTDASVDPDVGAADLAGQPGLSVHRGIYAPLIYPPSTWRISPLSCLAQTYKREATRTRRGTSAEIEEEELMSDETDEEALEAELKDEDEVDLGDMELAARQEQDLWDAVRWK